MSSVIDIVQRMLQTNRRVDFRSQKSQILIGQIEETINKDPLVR